jgi:ABC-2 type transport system ATP-binding protein
VDSVIRVAGCRKTYGSTVAVDEVSFDVRDGEIFGLIGPNGAGKTTTMECVEGLRKPDRGSISVLGMDPVRDIYRLQERIGVQLQQAQLQKRIKVWEAVDLWASLYRKNTIDGDRLLTQLGLADNRHAWFMTLSGGFLTTHLGRWARRPRRRVFFARSAARSASRRSARSC